MKKPGVRSLRRFLDRLRHDDPVKGVRGWRKWVLLWKQRRAVRRYQRAWAKQTPHLQLATFVSIIARHPEIRKAMREALGVAPAKDEKRIIAPGDRMFGRIQKLR